MNNRVVNVRWEVEMEEGLGGINGDRKKFKIK